MNYAEAISALFALSSRGIRLGVRRMDAALEFRGHPEEGMAYVQVGGTNGKGSVASMVANVLTRAGFRTGLYTSPHLHRWVERIRIDGKPMGEREAARRISEVLDAFAQEAAPETTFFELTTLMALEYFRDEQCDIAVLEVGLGGRLDATTAVTPAVTAITRVALDHTNILGDSIEAIAREKAGIIKPGVPLVLGVRDQPARRVISAVARRKQAPYLLADRDFEYLSRGMRSFDVRVGDRSYEGLRLSLPGAHQQQNAATAVAIVDELAHSSRFDARDALKVGLRTTRWPGRVEHVAKAPLTIVDAAHNLDGCRVLADHLASLTTTGKRVLVFGCMRDKDFTSMLRILGPQFDRVIYAPSVIPRSAPFSMLNRARKGARSESVEAALAHAKTLAGDDGLVVIAGSIFVVAAFRAHILGVRSDPAIRM